MFLEFTKEVDFRFECCRCKCLTLFLISMLTLGISFINKYLLLMIRSASSTKKPLMVLATSYIGDDTTANKRNKKWMVHWLYVLSCSKRWALESQRTKGTVEEQMRLILKSETAIY